MKSKRPSAQAQWMEACNRLSLIERESGLDKKWEKLKEQVGSFAGAEKYGNAERKVIFSLPDADLRIKVIHAYRECHLLFKERINEQIREYQDRVDDNGEKIRRWHLWTAIMLGLIFVGVGNILFGIAGALAGTVVAILYGLSSIQKGDREAKRDIEDAQKRIKMERLELDRLGENGLFSMWEEINGTESAEDSELCFFKTNF